MTGSEMSGAAPGASSRRRPSARRWRFLGRDISSNATLVALTIAAGGIVALAYSALLARKGLFAVLVPSPMVWALFAIGLFLTRYLKNGAFRFISLLWLIWFLVGNMNIAVGYFALRLGSIPDVSGAGALYLTAVITFISGGLFVQWRQEATRTKAPALFNPSTLQRLSPVSMAILMAFPFLMLANMYLTLGKLPILSGHSIVFEMYTENLGFLHELKVIILPALIVLVLRMRRPYFHTENLVYVALLLFFLFCQSADGKRDVATPFAVCLASLLGLMTGRTISNPRTVGALAAFIVLSVSVVIIRSGVITSGRMQAMPLFTVQMLGDEYKDFALSYTYLDIEKVQRAGYNWTESSIGGAMNRQVLSLFGYDKIKMISHDSAHVFENVFGRVLGVRTGIVCEFWFAFHWFMYLGMFLIGMLTQYLAALLLRCRTELGFISVLSLVGILGIQMAGQSTFTFGGFVQIFYGMGALYLIETQVGGKRRQQRAPSANLDALVQR